MNISRSSVAVVVLSCLALAGCDSDIRPPRTGVVNPAQTPAASAQDGASDERLSRQVALAEGLEFVPPSEDDIPDGPFGDVIRRGRDIFIDTPTHAPEYVGNGLSCQNCHMGAGRVADAAPLWGAYGRYPAYRSKNEHVNNFEERLQGCFEYSMNGRAPERGGEVLTALESYAFWMAGGAPLGKTLAGSGFPKGETPALEPDLARGKQVYDKSCALCHGSDGQGQQVAGRNVFPPLWGPQSYNWGAGMHSLDNAAAFIRANMPLGRSGTLDLQESWDVAMFVNSHERPQDPRFTGDVAKTRAAFHDSEYSLYGREIDGRVLGANPAK